MSSPKPEHQGHKSARSRQPPEEKKEHWLDKPVFAFLGMPIRRWVFVLVGFISALFLIGVLYFLTVKPEVSFAVEAEPLVKTANISLKEGETYSYQYTYSNSPPALVSYIVLRTSPCFLVRIEPEGKTPTELCITPEGEPLDARNFSLDFFQPWMLALHENFLWKN